MAEIIAHEFRRVSRQHLLHFETQQILVAPRGLMHADPQRGEEIESFRQIGRGYTRCQRGQPAHGVQIAQSAGPIFHVRLQMEDRVVEFRAPRSRQRDQPVRHNSAALGGVGSKAITQVSEHRFIARKKSPVEQAHRQLDVFFVIRRAVVHGLHRMAWTEAYVPQRLQKFRDDALHGRDLRFGFDDEQQVDVGKRKQLAASESSRGDERYAGRKPRGVEGGANALFDFRRSRRQRFLNAGYCQGIHNAASPRSSLRMRIASATS